MDRQAAVIKSEMSQTRADLAYKLSQLEAKARDMTPRRYIERHMPDYPWERAIGSALVAVGGWMAWRHYRHA
jgi:hypothetical protein